jgi:hypothetical protein
MAALWEIYKSKMYSKDQNGIPVVDTAGKKVLEPGADANIDKMLDAVKDEISTLTTLLTGGYFALVSIGDVKDLKAIIDTQDNVVVKWAAMFVMILPMLLWVISLAYANTLYLSFIGVAEGSNYEDAMKDKLEFSLFLMLLGLGVLIVILGGYILIPTPPQNV